MSILYIYQTLSDGKWFRQTANILEQLGLRALLKHPPAILLPCCARIWTHNFLEMGTHIYLTHWATHCPSTLIEGIHGMKILSFDHSLVEKRSEEWPAKWVHHSNSDFDFLCFDWIYQKGEQSFWLFSHKMYLSVPFSPAASASSCHVPSGTKPLFYAM